MPKLRIVNFPICQVLLKERAHASVVSLFENSHHIGRNPTPSSKNPNYRDKTIKPIISALLTPSTQLYNNRQSFRC